MKRMPRLLPLLLIAVGGVLAVRVIAGVSSWPEVAQGAQAWAEDLAPGLKPKAKAADAASTPSGQTLPSQAPPVPGAKAGPAPAAPPGDILAAQTPPAPPACAPTPAELARQAGLSPAELQTLQSLGARRTQLDERERDMDTQLALLSAAETKVDAKLAQLNSLKGDIQGLLGQADQQKQAEIDRLVNVYAKMPPKAAAPLFATLDDSVRLPVAAKIKDSALTAILAAMSPADAKTLTEKLAQRMNVADQARQAIAPNAPAPASPAATAQAGGKAAPAAPAPAKG